MAAATPMPARPSASPTNSVPRDFTQAAYLPTGQGWLCNWYIAYTGFMRPLAAGYDMYPDYPDNRHLVPAPLRSVQAFANSIDREHGVEGLSSPDDLSRLLLDFALRGAEVELTEADLALARAVREALCDLFVWRAGGDAAAKSMALIEATARAGRLVVRIEHGQPRLVATAGGVPGALATLVARVQTAAADGSLRRLKACRRDCCHWLFWDASPPASGVWCSMMVCGNRTKVRRHRDKATA